MAELFDLNGGIETVALEGDYGLYIVKVDGSGEPTDSGFTTLGTLASFIKTAETIVPEGAIQSTLHVGLSADESMTGAETSIPWDATLEDTTSGELAWSAGAPTRITVGAGVTRVAVSVNLRLKSGTNPVWSFVNVNGVGPVGAPLSIVSVDATNGGGANLYCELPVSSGDYLEVRLFSTSSFAVDDGNWTSFKVCVLERTSP